MRKILITGASNGLGFALAEHFLSNGETVVINTRTPTTAELTEKKIKCFLADYSVEPKFKNNLIEFDKKFIGPSTFENFLSLIALPYNRA